MPFPRFQNRNVFLSFLKEKFLFGETIEFIGLSHRVWGCEWPPNSYITTKSHLIMVDNLIEVHGTLQRRSLAAGGGAIVGIQVRVKMLKDVLLKEEERSKSHRNK